ncbi:DNA (cytosine-5-)-methyltransferase [Treponema pectinovorum]|uniref:DNA (cytosine-5-)-methyltransferase n=1 Tax=Treponema pectinovorum TaxID=164 RepID=UPI0011F0D69F|nr:DNA (cytosine-5-)-methyltransferase [Treponema pectinovorum]
MKETSLFDFPQIKINKPIRLIELFGGIGSQAMALRNIGADFETYRLVEFDKYAVASYNAIHGTNFVTTDIRDIHGADLGIVGKDRFCYLLTYSFPCTDLSVAGKMQGMSRTDWKKGKATRSGLLWEVERILSELQNQDLPQILLMENVPQVHAEKNRADFECWLSFLRSKGYQNFWQDLNAKDYGIPQSRKRCFCVSILSDDLIDFEFPKPIELKTVMKDFLEKTVDEKYYIKTNKAKKLIENLMAEKQKVTTGPISLSVCKPKRIDIANCITASDRGISNKANERNGVFELQKD